MSQPTLANRLKDVVDNPIILSFYAQKKCKHCMGRGVVTRSLPPSEHYESNEQLKNGWIKVSEICGCVKKSIKKEIRDGQDVSR
jgi:hypothetical protein